MKCRARPANITAIASSVSTKYSSSTFAADQPRNRMPASGTTLRATAFA